MKVWQIILVLIVIIGVIVVGVSLVNNTDEKMENVVDATNIDVQESKEELNLQNVDEMMSFIDKIYVGLELFPSLTSTEMPLTDIDMLTYETGITSTDKIDNVVVSMPMMSSQAYSLVIVKVKDKNDADSVAKEMSENINPNKWVCVSAEKIYATSSGNIAFLVMTNTEMAESVYESFKTNAGKCGPEYIIENALEEVPAYDAEITLE